jgi:ankyrin repeat protein
MEGSKKQLNAQLVEAAERSDLASVEAALAAGADVDAKDDIEGYTGLHHAASKNELGLVQFLIKNNANVEEQSKTGRHALHLAVRDGAEEVIKFLIEEAHASVLAKTDLDENMFHKAGFSGKAHILEYLIQKGCKGIDDADGLGNTPLAVAAQDNHLECIEILLKNGASPAGKAEDHQTPLHIASLWGHTEAVNLLLGAKANPNAQNAKGNTPLHEAAKKNHLGAVKALVAGGADPDIKNGEGQTPADLASKSLIRKQLVKQ